MQFGLSDEQEMIVKTVRAFVENEIYPHEAEVERTGEVPRELGLEIRDKCIEAGYFAANISEEYGGGGLGHLDFTLLERELGRASNALAVFFGRLIPGVRSLISLPAGVSAMPLGKFTILTLLGSALWNLLLIGSGWLLGTQYHVIEAHMNSGAFQDPFKAPGNAMSRMQKITVDGNGMPELELFIDRVIPPSRPLREGEVLQQGNYDDTEWVRYVKIRSDKVSEFWGQDMYIGANVLLPPGYDENSPQKYPVLYMQGHSSGFTPMPWAPDEWFVPAYQPGHPAVPEQGVELVLGNTLEQGGGLEAVA